LTDHSALSAPYHRIDRPILAASRVFAGDVASAQMRLRREVERFAPKGLPVYLMLCAPDDAPAFSASHQQASQHLATQPSVSQPSVSQTKPKLGPETFASALLSGRSFPMLESVPVSAPVGSFKVWRVDLSALSKS
jgi:hypothetical protein